MSVSEKINTLLIKAKIRAEYLFNGTVCGYSARTYESTRESFIIDADTVSIIIFTGIGVIYKNHIYFGPPAPIAVYLGLWFDMNSGQELETKPIKICGPFNIIKNNINSGEIIKYGNGYVRMPIRGVQCLGETMKNTVRPVSINLVVENVIYCDYSNSATIPAEWLFNGAD